MALSTVGLTGYTTSDSSGPLAVTTGGALSEPGTYDEKKPSDYWSLSKCKRAYTDYLFSKRPEITEQQESRRYRHGAHWNADQIKILNDRKQPVVTYNRISRKVDGICGLMEKYRAEPRAFPRHPRHQQSADLATASIRSGLERAKWKRVSPKCTETGAVDGIGGVEFVLTRNPDGSYEIDLEDVDTTGFFYDPRSKKEDFSDATYMGMGKWADVDVLIDMMPDKEDEIKASEGQGDELTSNSDSDNNAWFMASGDRKSVRLVYLCYRHKGGWCWALFTGAHILMEGKSYFTDRVGNGVCSFVMFSAAVDHDNDRYGFVRNLKSAQDEINQRRSKGLHELHTRRIIGEEGAFDDIEKVRREAVRPDGVVLRNKGYDAEFDDNKKQQDIVGQLKFLEDAKNEIEMFGPGSAVMGAPAVANRSGRAISLMMQAGIAELGPFVIAHHSWKQRVYEQMYYGIKKWWTNERWIRLTDDEGVQQFVQVNALQVGPMGMPQIVNSLAELDVDVVLDEGPDSATMMEDLYETLSTVIPAIAPMLSPPEVRAVVEMMIENSPLSAEAKRKFKQASASAVQQQQAQQPIQQAAQQIELGKGQAEIIERQSKAQLNAAQAQKALTPEQPRPVQPKQELHPVLQMEKAFSEIDKNRAAAEQQRAKATEAQTKAQLQPIDYVQRAQQAMHDAAYDVADLRIRKYEADSARQRPASGA
jgi:hypothetical protein